MANNNGKTTSIRTSTLLGRLFKTASLERFMESNSKVMQVPPFHTYITDLCAQMNEVPNRVINRSGIERTFGHQLFRGVRFPSRDKVIQLAFGFGLDVEGTQKLLKAAQKSLLYPKIKRDAAILFCINNHKDIIETQEMLEKLELSLLGGEEKHG